MIGSPRPPCLEFAFEFQLQLGERIHIDGGDGRMRGAVLVQGGRISGPGLNGIVVGGSGGDFPLVRQDGGAHFDAVYLLRTDDGEHILKRNSGVRHADPDVIRRLMAQEDVSADEYYMRLCPRFEAPQGRYAWLNDTIFVGVGMRRPSGSIFRYWKIT